MSGADPPRRAVFDRPHEEDIDICVSDGIDAQLTLCTRCERFAGKSGESVFIPHDSWMPLTPVWAPMPNRPKPGDIILVEADTAIKKDLREIAARAHSPVSEGELAALVGACAAPISHWVERLGLFTRVTLRGASLALHPPGLSSTAYDPTSDEYRGLHIDDHDKLPLDRRDDAFVLLNINLGRADRQIRFVAHTIASMAKLTAAHASPKRASDLKDIWLSSREPRIYSLTIPPLHAYLVRTQNLIHDGATNSGGDPDVSLLAALFAE